MRYLSVLCTALFLITSCGGGSSSGGGSSDETSFDTSNYYYQPGDNDVMIYRITVEADLHDLQSYKKSAFGLNSTGIPDKYHYETLNGLEGNPHILETVTEGSDLASCTDTTGLIYYTPEGEKIIDDQRYSAEPPVWLFTNVDDTTITGDEEPESVVAGRKYETTIEEVLFKHSNPPVEVGTRTITTTITPLNIVSVTVPEGTHEALRFRTKSFSEETIGGSTVKLTGSGTMWFGRNRGLVKVEMEYTKEEEGKDSENFYYLLELADITPSGEAALPASLQIAPPARAVPLSSFMKNISHITHPRLP